MSGRFDGAVVMVTGGGSGIGRAIGVRMASEGAFVGVLDVDRDRAAESVRLIEAEGGSASAHLVDVRNRAQISEAAEAVVADRGRVDFLVNNAGLVTMSGFADTTEEEWDLVVDVNLKGQFLTSQVVAPHIAAAGGGAIVNLSTVEADVVVTASGQCQAHYNASKGGVKMLTKALAVSLASDGIRVNCVAPSAIHTHFTGGDVTQDPEAMRFLSERLLIPRIGEPEDIAAAVAFLLSADASYITGIQLPVDGGWLTR